MKILLFSTLFPNAAERTKGVFVENRLRHLKNDADVDVKVIAPVPYFPFTHSVFGTYAQYAKAPLYEQRDGVDIYHPRYLVLPKVGMNLTPHTLYRAGLKMAKELIENGFDFDIIDAHYLYPDGVAASWIATALNKPFVMTARGSDVTQIPDYTRPRQQILKAVTAASHVNTVSESLRQGLIDLGADGSKITTLRNGIDLEMFKSSERNETRKNLGLGTEKVVVFAGLLIERKRVDLILEVTAKIPDLVALIIGDGPELKNLQDQANILGITNRVQFLGQKEHHKLKKYFSAADILLLLSEREGWPNVLLEAMACGTPVVATAVGGVEEFVGRPDASPESGKFVRSHDAEEIAETVRALLEDYPDREAVRTYAEGFSWEDTSRGQMKIFTQVIEKIKE